MWEISRQQRNDKRNEEVPNYRRFAWGINCRYWPQVDFIIFSEMHIGTHTPSGHQSASTCYINDDTNNECSLWRQPDSGVALPMTGCGWACCFNAIVLSPHLSNCILVISCLGRPLVFVYIFFFSLLFRCATTDFLLNKEAQRANSVFALSFFFSSLSRHEVERNQTNKAKNCTLLEWCTVGTNAKRCDFLLLLLLSLFTSYLFRLTWKLQRRRKIFAKIPRWFSWQQTGRR